MYNRMKCRLIYLFFLALVLPSPPLAARDTNPLLEMVGKECHHYFDRYESLCDSLFWGDSLARVRLVRLFTEAAQADPTGVWELDRQRIAGHVRFYESRKGGYTPSADYTAERFAEDLLAIARTAEKSGLEALRLRALFNAASVYRIFACDYQRAFSLYLEAAARAANVPLGEFPWKFYLYLEIADFYYSFREYAEAARFYRLIAEDEEMIADNHRLYPALNGLGLCYRSEADFERSDSCFLRILELSAPIGEDRYVWEGIAGGNVGYNFYLRGDNDRALVWMEPALAKMKRPNDDSFAASLAAKIADIYLQRGDLTNGGNYLHRALDFHRRTRLPQKDSRLLEVETRYQTLRGDRRKADACLDAALRAKEREQEAFSGLVLRRLEQQLRAADRKVHEQELGTEKIRSRMYRRTALLVSVALGVILLLLVLVCVYYRRTRTAYRELVRKSQRWAGVEAERGAAVSGDCEPLERVDDTAESSSSCRTEPQKAQAEPEAFDRTIMHAVERAVIDGKMYRQADLTLDMLAAATGYSRYYLSGALNRCTGVNFNAYVNELRIKEAVRLMSDPANATLTVDAIAFDAGFNDRKNFYRVFKKVTGLSPTQFRRNIAS